MLAAGLDRTNAAGHGLVDLGPRGHKRLVWDFRCYRGTVGGAPPQSAIIVGRDPQSPRGKPGGQPAAELALPKPRAQTTVRTMQRTAERKAW